MAPACRSRSLDAARSRAEKRAQRFLDAAFELMDEKGTTDFTIQEVIDRSKQSLRGFYQYFNGKDELLLALFEETRARVDRRPPRRGRRARPSRSSGSTRSSSGSTSGAIRTDTPRKRGAHNRRPISEFMVQLAATIPTACRRRSRPSRELLVELVDAATAAGRHRGGRHAAHRRARAAHGDVQLVRQPPRPERAPAHRAPRRRGSSASTASARRLTA